MKQGAKKGYEFLLYRVLDQWDEFIVSSTRAMGYPARIELIVTGGRNCNPSQLWALQSFQKQNKEEILTFIWEVEAKQNKAKENYLQLCDEVATAGMPIIIENVTSSPITNAQK